MTPPRHIRLTIGFDADQISDQLMSYYHPRLRHPTGLFEGEVYFREGDTFGLRVVGTGKPAHFQGFYVIDCCLTTRPKIVYAVPATELEAPKVRYAQPSPFVEPGGASYALPLEFVPPTADLPDSAEQMFILDWFRTLTVGKHQGRWEISLLLTVRIDRGGDKFEQRVFSFDPESEVGSGRGNDQTGGA
jgi:hypothetical protein